MPIPRYKFHSLLMSLYYLSWITYKIFDCHIFEFSGSAFSHSRSRHYHQWHVCMKISDVSTCSSVTREKISPFNLRTYTHSCHSPLMPFISTSSIECRLTRDDIELGIQRDAIGVREKFPSDWPLFQFCELLANFSSYLAFSFHLRTFKDLLKVKWIGMKKLKVGKLILSLFYY